MFMMERLFPTVCIYSHRYAGRCIYGTETCSAMSKLLADGNFHFLSLEEEEAEFFRRMLGETHIVRLSYVETNGKGKVFRVSGPLEDYLT